MLKIPPCHCYMFSNSRFIWTGPRVESKGRWNHTARSTERGSTNAPQIGSRKLVLGIWLSPYPHPSDRPHPCSWPSTTTYLSPPDRAVQIVDRAASPVPSTPTCQYKERSLPMRRAREPLWLYTYYSIRFIIQF
jgi:hypothetical protein